MIQQMKITRIGVLAVATGLGVGYSPLVPGTIGSLWGALLCGVAFHLKLPIASYVICSLFLFLVGVPLCSRAAEIMNSKDPGAIVWDEIKPCPWSICRCY